MRSQGPGAWGSALTDEQLAAMTDEQRAQLDLLRKATERIDAQWNELSDTQNPITQPDTQQ